MNQSISQILAQLIPLSQVASIVNTVWIVFVVIAFVMLCVGYVMRVSRQDSGMKQSLGAFAILAACVWLSPSLINLAEVIANGIVQAIASADPQINWMVVNNPGSATLSLDFSQPFSIIAKYVAGQFPDIGSTQWWEIGKWADYLMRSFFIFATAAVAIATVFLMQVMLILQKIILLFSTLFIPVFVAGLFLPAMQGASQNFLKQIAGTAMWPVGWAIWHIGTMAFLQTMHPPSWGASLPELFLAFVGLGVVCLWMIFGTFFAPLFIWQSVTHGTNFAAGMTGGFAATLATHAANTIRSATRLAGAAYGTIGGSGGAQVGAKIGEIAGGALASPAESIGQISERVSGEKMVMPSSRSAALADAAIKHISKTK